MDCRCGGRLKTKETRIRQYGIYRRRVCDVCGKAVSTAEVEISALKDADNKSIVERMKGG